jgi:hypothetical protein
MEKGWWWVGIRQDGTRRICTFAFEERPYEVDVTVEDDLRISGVAVRRAEEIPGSVSAREIVRLPLSTILRAAIVAATKGLHSHREIDALMRAPKGRPERGKSAKFYQELADMYRALVASGEPHPAKEIAKRKRIDDPNTVHQWLHRARNIGFLEREHQVVRAGKEKRRGRKRKT